MNRDWLVKFVLGTSLGALGVVGLGVLFPDAVPNLGDIALLRGRLAGSATLFAAFTVPPHEGAPANAGPEPGLLRWSRDGVLVVQTSDLRFRYDGDTLWEDGVRGHFQHPRVVAVRFGRFARALRRGLENQRVRAVRTGELPNYLWQPGVDLFRMRLDGPWAGGLELVMGIDAVGGELVELALTDREGTPQRYAGHQLRATFGRVEWGVPLGPDMASTQHVPLHQLGYRTVFSDRPPAVIRDLPFHERVQHTPMAFLRDASQGVRGAHGATVVDVMMPTLWCNTAEASATETAQLVFEVDAGLDSAGSLAMAASAGCSLWVAAEPRTAHVLSDGVTGTLQLTATVQQGREILWTDDIVVEHAGSGGVDYGQPRIRADLPAGTEAEGLQFVLDVSMDLQCSVAQGKGRLRTYFGGIAHPRVHWTCPADIDAPWVTASTQ